MRQIKDASESLKGEMMGSVRDVEREIYENRRSFTKEIDETIKKIESDEKGPEKE